MRVIIVRAGQVGSSIAESLDEDPEIVVVDTDTESALASQQISESAADLPARVIIGANTRGGQFITLREDMIAEIGDHVISFAETDAIDSVAAQM